MYVCNEVRFGFIPTPLEDTQSIEDDYAQITNLKIEASGIVFLLLSIALKITVPSVWRPSVLPADGSPSAADFTREIPAEGQTGIRRSVPHQLGTPPGATRTNGMGL